MTASLVGRPSHPGTCFWHFCWILSLSSVVNIIWSNCWQSNPQVGECVNRTVSSTWDFSVKEGVWSFQLYRSLVERGNKPGRGFHPHQEVPQCRQREQETPLPTTDHLWLPWKSAKGAQLWSRKLGGWGWGKGRRSALQGSRRSE